MKIVKDPSKILRKKLKNIDNSLPKLSELIFSIRKTMRENQGIGLAANQVGLDMQLFIIDENIATEHNAPSVYINPKITNFSKDTNEMEEGCLSLPNYWVPIKRAKKIMIKAQNEKGDKFKIKARGFLARVLQHEYDHLQGVLIKDRQKQHNA